jgi:hypothetical protein
MRMSNIKPRMGPLEHTNHHRSFYSSKIGLYSFNSPAPVPLKYHEFIYDKKELELVNYVVNNDSVTNLSHLSQKKQNREEEGIERPAQTLIK